MNPSSPNNLDDSMMLLVVGARALKGFGMSPIQPKIVEDLKIIRSGEAQVIKD